MFFVLVRERNLDHWSSRSIRCKNRSRLAWMKSPDYSSSGSEIKANWWRPWKMCRNSLKTWNISKNNTPSYYKRNWGLKVCGRLLFLYWKVTNNPCFISELRARSGKLKRESKKIVSNTTVFTRFVWLLARWTGGIYGLLTFREPLRYCPNWYEKAYSLMHFRLSPSGDIKCAVAYLLMRRLFCCIVDRLQHKWVSCVILKIRFFSVLINYLGCLTNWENVQERK